MIKKILFIILLIMLFIALCILSLFIGVSDIGLNELLSNANQQDIFFYSRLPRLISILISGSSISICGLILQYLTRNKFVSPTTIGLNACSSLGIILSLIFLSSPTSFFTTDLCYRNNAYWSYNIYTDII